MGTVQMETPPVGLDAQCTRASPSPDHGGWSVAEQPRVEQSLARAPAPALDGLDLDSMQPEPVTETAATIRAAVRTWCCRELARWDFSRDALMGLMLAVGDLSDEEVLSFARSHS